VALFVNFGYSLQSAENKSLNTRKRGTGTNLGHVRRHVFQRLAAGGLLYPFEVIFSKKSVISDIGSTARTIATQAI
jgi:hypothetical protein